MIVQHIQMLIGLSDDFEKELYDKVKSSAKSPADAIRKLNKMKYELPDHTSGTRDEVIAYSLSYKEIDDVIKMIREEAMRREWPTS